MNKNKRLRLTEAQLKIDEGRQIIQEVMDEEESAMENLPDSLREGEKGDAMQAAIDAMEEAIDSLDQADSSINEASN